MLTSATKRLILPFSSPKSRDQEVEAAAVFAVAELNRSRGSGLFNRQPQETLAFIAKIGYPLWVYQKNSNSVIVFDALDCYSHSISYDEAPSAAVFMDNLQTYQRPRESYIAFLCDHSNYFQQPPKIKQFQFRGLIHGADFRDDFSLYRREATELTSPAALLQPILEEQTIALTFGEMDKLLAFHAEDKAKLVECLKLMKKTSSQYTTEIAFEATAAKEEADAKIKAQQEFINPQIAKLTKEYNRKIKELTASFDNELDDLQKLKTKTDKFIASSESDIREYERNAKAAGKKGHEIYMRRWKEKIKLSEKELSGLRKELKNIENNINKLSRQKGIDISHLTQELDAEVKLARQPLIELEAARDAKIFAFKQESNRLIACEKPIAEGIDISMQLRESVGRAFDGLSINEQLKTPALVYVPFYVVCYEAASGRRYMCVSPSMLGSFDLSAKLRGVFGKSKAKDMLSPRFNAIAALISKAEALTRENSIFEEQLLGLGERNNLLISDAFHQNALTGLAILRQTQWLSEKEAAELSSRLTA